MTRSYVEDNIDRSWKRMDVAALYMLQFRWQDKDCSSDKLRYRQTTNNSRKWNPSCRYGTVMGGLLSEKFLDTNASIPFAGPPLNNPSLQKYKRMVDAWCGWSLFHTLLQTLKMVSLKHGVPIVTVAVRYILNQTSVAVSMVGVRLGLSEHIRDTNAILSLNWMKRI
ncbi:unnamed protein product [Urochloa humidicola]